MLTPTRYNNISKNLLFTPNNEDRAMQSQINASKIAQPYKNYHTNMSNNYSKNQSFVPDGSINSSCSR